MEAFLSAMAGECDSVIVVVEQSEDGRKFNRGQLLNVGFRIAAQALPGLESYVTHDVDLLPSADMRAVYARRPPEGHAVHLASVWGKYAYATFIGGVLAFRSEDFERVNGFPNDYWGWGLEDDQLALRMAHCGLKPLRVRAGSFEDLDPVHMKGFLDRGNREEIKQHLPWYNVEMFKRRDLVLDANWERNGLRGLDFRELSRVEQGRLRHVVVELGPLDEATGVRVPG